MNTQTLDKMHKMRLWGMYHGFKSSLEHQQEGVTGYTADELIHYLINAEWDERQNRSMELKIRNARFRYKADMDDLYYHTPRNMDKNQMMRLGDCSFVDKAECILITGPTGIGKSYIASALGHHACAKGYRVLYHNLPKLFSRLKMSRADGSYLKETARLERQQLLILDDFGLQPLDAQNRTALMELIEDRHGKSALIITSQLPVSKWYDVIGEKTIADAILDRIVHQSHRIELQGESLRKIKTRSAKF